jgi:hypothetical protein
LEIVTWSHPADAISAAEIVTVSCVELTKVVVRWLPLKFAIEPATKPDPFTVTANPVPAVTTLEGLIDVITGGATPLPLRFNTKGLLGVSETTVRVAPRAPAARGAKSM